MDFLAVLATFADGLVRAAFGAAPALRRRAGFAPRVFDAAFFLAADFLPARFFAGFPRSLLAALRSCCHPDCRPQPAG